MGGGLIAAYALLWWGLMMSLGFMNTKTYKVVLLAIMINIGFACLGYYTYNTPEFKQHMIEMQKR